MASIQRRSQSSSNNLAKSIINPFMSTQQKVGKALQDFYDLFKVISLSPALDLVEDSKCYKIEAGNAWIG